MAEALAGRVRARILIEASTESEWVARCLERLGHEVIVADPNFAPMYATRQRKVKTDRRDARALAEACVLGAYRRAHRLSDAKRHVRGRLGVRDVLVRTRMRYIALIRSRLRQEGWRIPTGTAERFSRRVLALPLPGRLRSEVAPLLAVMRQVTQQVGYSDERIATLTQTDARVRRLQSVPSIGPVTAVAFVAALDDAHRFGRAHEVEAYVGLVPREWSSGETQRRGRITKAGSLEGYIAEVIQAADGATYGRPPEQGDLHVHLRAARQPQCGVGGLRNQQIVTEVTPHFQPPTTDWSYEALLDLCQLQARVRISGWLLHDYQHIRDIGAWRASAWEIHPVTSIEVWSPEREEWQRLR